MVLVVLSVLGTALATVSFANVKLTTIDRDYQSTYYIAEAGANQTVASLIVKVNELSEQSLSHDEYFNLLDQYINSELEVTITDYQSNFGDMPQATVKLEDRKVVSEQEGSNYSERVMSYTINSKGEIGRSNRSVNSTVEITHRIETAPSGGGQSPFDYVLYSGSSHTLQNAGGGNYKGSVYGETVKFDATNTKIDGSVIAKQSVALRSALDITGDVYAMNGHVELTNSDVVVEGDIHAQDYVHLSHGTKARSIYAGGYVNLTSGNTVTGDIHANGYVATSSGSNIKNVFTNSYMNFGSNIVVNGDIHAGGRVGQSNSGNNVTVNGNIYSNSYVVTRSYNSFAFNGNVHAGDYIDHGEGNTITGNVVAAGTVNNKGQIFGGIKENDSPIVPTVPQSPDFSSYSEIGGKVQLTEFDIGSSEISADQNSTTHNISPGAYKNLSLKWNDTVNLVSGNYYFNQFNANQNSIRLNIDLSDGPVNIYVKENIIFGSGLEIYVSETGSDYTRMDKDFIMNNEEKAKNIAGQIYFETHNNFTLPNDVAFLGTILANNNIFTSSNVVIVGAYAVNEGTISMNYGPTVIYAPPTTSAGAGGSIGTGGSGSGTDGHGENIVSPGSRVTVKTPAKET